MPARPCPSRTPSGCARRIVELLVAGEVYRAYMHPDQRLSPLARKRIEDAFVGAVAARLDLEPELELLMHLAHVEGEQDPAAVDFAIRLQQTWGPVMAKGIEDTTFYRWHRLVALNEVGGDPAVLDSRQPGARCTSGPRAQQRDWPLRHDHAVHPRHQAQRGRAGPAARRRR